MGTPEFAVPSLDILYRAGYEIQAVVTVPDKPAGRGKLLQVSPVKQYALDHNLPVLQPEKLRSPDFVNKLRDLAPDIMVVVAFRMLPAMVWSIPRIGTFNLHASLLPDYRGAAPINWAIIHGEKVSGATTFFIDKEIDTGNILLQCKVNIPDAWDAGNLHDVLMEEGAKLVLATVQGLGEGTLTPKPQEESKALHEAPKLFKEDCRIDWTGSAESIHNFIRGLSPYPAAWSLWDEKMFKIFSTRMTGTDSGQAGALTLNDKGDRLFVQTGENTLELLEVQIEGKKRMSAAQFLMGIRGSFPSHLI